MNTQKTHIVIGLGMRPYTTIVEKIHKVGACFILHYPASWGRTLRDAVALGFRCHVGDVSVHFHACGNDRTRSEPITEQTELMTHHQVTSWASSP